MSRERPILFSAPMVRAILAGTKTQTRRVAKIDSVAYGKPVQWVSVAPCTTGIMEVRCPYGEPGDRLWVRESFSGARAYETRGYPLREWGNKIFYWADGQPRSGDWTRPRPSIHMPRSLSRITLEITGVRVEKLQEISEADAVAEGTPCYVCGRVMDGLGEDDCHCFHTKARPSDYRALWEQINGRGSWDANPWVWVLEFRKLERQG